MQKANTFKLFLNSISLLAVLVINYLSKTGMFQMTVGEVSSKYDSLIVPAGYAFSIWGLIYFMLILFVGYQWVQWFKPKKSEVIDQTGYWFLLANIDNFFWIIFWLNEHIGVSLLCMILLLISLILLIYRLKLEVWDAPLTTIIFVWWPVCIYTGWIIIATVANTAAFLVSVSWKGWGISQQAWTILLIAVSVVIYVLLIYRRNMREAAVVGVWAYVAIAVRQWDTNVSIVIVSLIASVILLSYVFYHGYQNRSTSPLQKIMDKYKS